MTNPTRQQADAAQLAVTKFWIDTHGSGILCPPTLVLGAGNAPFTGEFPWSERECIEIGGVPIINPSGLMVGVNAVVCEDAEKGARIALQGVRAAKPFPRRLTQEALLGIAERTQRYGSCLSLAEFLVFGADHIASSSCPNGFPLIVRPASLICGKVLISGPNLFLGCVVLVTNPKEVEPGEAAVIAQAGVDAFERIPIAA